MKSSRKSRKSLCIIGSGNMWVSRCAGENSNFHTRPGKLFAQRAKNIRALSEAL